MGTVLCTHKRDFSTVTLIPGRRIDRGGGGGSDFTTIEGRSQTSVFFRSPLDQQEAIGVVFRSMHPPQAILEPRRVRVTLIPGSTLAVNSVVKLHCTLAWNVAMWRGEIKKCLHFEVFADFTF